MYELIIIGGGPAGMTAGIYAARQGLNTLMITKDFGGQMGRKAVAIENYPGFLKISGKELIDRFKKHFQKYKIPVVFDAVVKIKKLQRGFLVLTEEKRRFRALSVIIASGAEPRSLKIPDEKKYIGRGLSYCVVCDGPLFKGKRVAVIGGGNSGFEAAYFLSKIARKVYILEGASEVRADAENRERIRRLKNVKVITNALIERIKGDQFIKGIIYRDKSTNEQKELSVEGVFVEIGSQPATSFAKGLVDLTPRGEIKVDSETYQTRTPGLFAVGDCNEGAFRQIITACGEGAKAVLAAHQYLQKLTLKRKR